MLLVSFMGSSKLQINPCHPNHTVLTKAYITMLRSVKRKSPSLTIIIGWFLEYISIAGKNCFEKFGSVCFDCITR